MACLVVVFSFVTCGSVRVRVESTYIFLLFFFLQVKEVVRDGCPHRHYWCIIPQIMQIVSGMKTRGRYILILRRGKVGRMGVSESERGSDLI